MALIRSERNGPWASLQRAGLWSLSLGYRLGVAIRNKAFDHGWKTISLIITYVASGAPVFLLKFFALDKVFRRPASSTPTAASDSQATDAKTNAVQPHAA